MAMPMVLALTAKLIGRASRRSAGERGRMAWAANRSTTVRNAVAAMTMNRIVRTDGGWSFTGAEGRGARSSQERQPG